MATDAQAIALQILQSNIQLPPVPTVGVQLLSLNRQPIEEINLSNFIQLVETDPSLVTRLLQMANSAYFGSAVKISSLRQAVVHIGLEEALSAVSWYFFQTALPKFPKLEGFSGKDYWSHSWACAVANRMLGRQDLNIDCLPGELYIAGLLHGVGKLILALHRPADFLQCLENAGMYNLPLFQAELDILGTTDTDIAYEILKTWEFPENICIGVKHFSNPDAAPLQFRQFAQVTQFAYYIANTSGVGNNGDLFSFDLGDTVLGKNSDSPLSDENTRNRVVKDIYDTIRKKHAALSDKESDTAPPSPSTKTVNRNSGSTKRKKAQKKVGWLSRLLQIFK